MPTHGTAPKPIASAPGDKIKAANSRMFYIGISGAVGGAMAILADLMQKEQASAVVKVDQTLRTILRIPSRPAIVALVLVAVAVALCFIFAVDSGKSAFYRGASILTILMTVVPYKVPPSISSDANQPAPTETTSLWDRLVPKVFAQAPPRANPTFRIDVHLTPSDGKKVESAIYTLADPATGGVIARSRALGKDFSFYAAAGRDYKLRVEVPGYNIVERPLSVRTAQTLNISVSPTWLPLSIQRVWR